MALKTLSNSGTLSESSLQKSFDMAILNLLLGTPDRKVLAIKKIQEIFDISQECESLIDDALLV
ncbi:MAG TPA: hypothetical protein VM050_10825 [Patescibacteria group bacterium]|nr:hypothetical protein [Patescibacteria group bacterium]